MKQQTQLSLTNRATRLKVSHSRSPDMVQFRLLGMHSFICIVFTARSYA